MNYDHLIEAIAELHSVSVGRAARAVNQTLVLRNWVIGGYLVEYEQGGEDRAAYGAQLVEKMAGDLRSRGIKGLGISVLRLSRRIFELYPQIRQSVITEIDSGCSVWNSATTGCRIEAATDSSSTKIKKGPAPLPPDRLLEHSWTHLLRDPYILEFTGLAERPAYLEKDLETSLLDDLQAFLFVVDRRIVVDEAHERAKKLAQELANPEGEICQGVAEALRELSGDPNQSRWITSSCAAGFTAIRAGFATRPRRRFSRRPWIRPGRGCFSAAMASRRECARFMPGYSRMTR